MRIHDFHRCAFAGGLRPTGRRRWLRWLPVLLLAGVPTAGVAQIVAGRVIDTGTDAPVEAVLVELMRPDSTRVRGTLSGQTGRYALTVNVPGRYLIRLDRLGYRATWLGPFEIRSDTALDLRVDPEPVSLAPIEATGSGRCAVRPEVGVATAKLWEQIRKVLAVADVVNQEGLLEFDLLRFERELDLRRAHQRRELADIWTGSDPFQGYPGDVLARYGFIQPADASSIYWFMPDADVILSEAFLDTHCFSVVERYDQDRRLLGLQFEPILDGRDEPERDISNPDFDELVRNDPADVTGVLWADAATGALESLDYGYTGIRSNELRALSGGYARFEQLVGGTWVIRQWWIRMPMFQTSTRAGGRRLREAGMRETGGELVAVRDTTGTPVTRRTGQPVTGRLIRSDGPAAFPFDSLTFVRFSGTAHLAGVDSTGAFAFPDVAPGRYLALFHHPLLDTLGIDIPVTAFNMGRTPLRLDMKVPSRREALAGICPDMDADSRRGVILVVLSRDADPADPVPGEAVNLRSVQGERTIRRATTTDDGRARFCDVPGNEALEIQLPDHPEVRVSVSVEPGGVARRDITVGR